MKEKSLKKSTQIVTYIVEGDLILVKTSDREVFILPYSEENENTVISVIERQRKLWYYDPGDALFHKAFAVYELMQIPNAINNCQQYDGMIFKASLVASAACAITFSALSVVDIMSEKELKQLLADMEKLSNLKMGISEIIDFNTIKNHIKSLMFEDMRPVYRDSEEEKGPVLVKQ